MTPGPLQFVAAVASLVLALPPGWCCPPVRHVRAEPAPAPATCCHRTAPVRPADPEPPPTPQKAACCCPRDATVPEQPVQPAGPAAPTGLLVSDVPAFAAGSSRAGVVGVFDPPGPSLRVLQCVWRC